MQDRSGNLDAALAAYAEAARYYDRTNDDRGKAGVVVNRGSSLARAARWQEARAALEEALTLFEQLSDFRGQAFALGSLSSVSANMGDVQAEHEYNALALAAYRKLGGKMQIARVLYNMALAHRRNGEMSSADEALAEAADLFSQVGSTPYETAVRSQLADQAMKRARLDAAADHIAAGKALSSDDAMHRARLLTAEGRLALLRHEPALARELFQQARELRAGVGADGWVMASDLDLARVQLSEGKAVRAEESARRLARGFNEANDAYGHAASLVVLGQALLEQGRGEAAMRAAESTRALLESSPDFYLSLETSLLEAGASSAAAADERLSWVIEEARARGFIELALRAELLRVQHLSRAGRGEEAKALLSAVADASADRELAALSGAVQSLLVTQASE